MNKLDKMIEEALAEEDRALLDETAELGFFPLFFKQFRGRDGWINMLTMVMIFPFACGAIWSGWKFFQATEALAAVHWGLSSAVLLIMVGFLKIYFFNEMQTDRVMRELKRVELMIAARDK